MHEKPPQWQALEAAHQAAISRTATALIIAIALTIGPARGWEPLAIATALAAGHTLTASLERGLLDRLLQARRPGRLPAILRVESSSTLLVLAPAALLAFTAALLAASQTTGTLAIIAATLALALSSAARGYASRITLTGLLHQPTRTSTLTAPLVSGAAILSGWTGGPHLLQALAAGHLAGLAVLLAALRRVGALDPTLAGKPSLGVPGLAWLTPSLRLVAVIPLGLAGLDPGPLLAGVLLLDAASRLAHAYLDPMGPVALTSLAGPPIATLWLGGPLEAATVAGLSATFWVEGRGWDPLLGVLAV